MVEQVKRMPEGVEYLGLVMTAGEAQALTPELKSNLSEIMALVAERSQQYGDTDLVGALQSARRLLDGRGGSIHVYSDEAGLGTVAACEEELSLLASQKAALVPHLTRAERPQNVAVISANYGEGVEGGSVRFETTDKMTVRSPPSPSFQMEQRSPLLCRYLQVKLSKKW